MTKSILLSKQKINELKKQLKDLKASLSEQKAEQVKRGGAYDSWHETAAYGATQAALEAKVKELTAILEKVDLLSDKIKSDKGVLGSWIELIDEKGKSFKYRLVHPLEAKPEENLLSIESPLGKLLLGKKRGDVLDFNGRSFKVISIS